MTENKQSKLDEVVDIENLIIGEQEVPKLDVAKFIGNDVTLAKPITRKGEYGFYIDVTSNEVLETIETENGTIELQPTRRFGLKTNDEGKVYWTENMSIGKFLKSKNLKHYNEIEGVSVKVQTRTDDNGQEWLTF